MKALKSADFITACVIVIIAIYVYREAAAMPWDGRGTGAGGYPMLVAAGLFLLGLALGAQALLRAGQEPRKKSLDRAQFLHQGLRVFVFALMVLVYTQILDPLGFIVSTIAFLIASVFFFGQKSRIVTLVFSVALTATAYAIFRYGFLVLLPTGRVFG